jgi:hypothetical protein
MTRYYQDYADRSEPAGIDSPTEMRLSARDLRTRAPYLHDSNDRNIVLRLADDYERRADALERHRLRAAS